MHNNRYIISNIKASYLNNHNQPIQIKKSKIPSTKIMYNFRTSTRSWYQLLIWFNSIRSHNSNCTRVAHRLLEASLRRKTNRDNWIQIWLRSNFQHKIKSIHQREEFWTLSYQLIDRILVYWVIQILVSCSNFRISRIFRKASSNSRDLWNQIAFKNLKKNQLCWVP